mmetsp:Transcript_6666/g.11808  ORF Transcript_6666/g.11808 Transcript_6666/m.11808 type:complete len:82 (+) Transcript_6666:210-455(+)
MFVNALDAGSLNRVCNETNLTMITTADCEGPSAEVSCDCCTSCCNDGVDPCDHHTSILAVADRCIGNEACVPEDFKLYVYK